MEPPRYLAVMDRMNPLIVGVLHSPAHWLLSPGLMTVSLDGRRTGVRRRFPVGYHDQGDAVVVLVSDAAGRNWWRNFREPWPAELRIRGRTRSVVGEALRPGSDEYRLRAEKSFRRAAFIPRMFEIEFDRQAGLSDEQLKTLGEYAAIVSFRER
jgi:hypothetical protein